MADYQTIMKALRKADAAGDTAGAKRLAQMARDAQSSPQETGTAYESPIWPFKKDTEGKVSFDSDVGVLGGLKRAFTLPHDVMTGEVDPMSDEGLGRVLETATIASPMSALARSGMKSTGAAANALKRQAIQSPSPEALKAEAKAGYDQVRDMGVDYSSDHVVGMARKAQMALEKEGFNSENAGQTFKLLNKLQSAPKDSIAPISGLSTAKSSFQKIPKTIALEDNPDYAAAQVAIRAITKFITKPDPASVVAGPASAAGKILKEADANYAPYKRSKKLTDIDQKSSRRAKSSNSGSNIGNSVRGRVASMLEKDKQTRGFSKEELQALESVSDGSLAANSTRNIGNLLGGGGGLGMIASGSAGAFAGGPLGAIALPGAGMASKALSNKLTRKALSAADELVRKRSPLYERMAKEAPMQAAGVPHSRDALIRALLLQQQAN